MTPDPELITALAER
ncbi:hypothetical protein LINPERHAP2_LOCUS33812 [Linum perenne]